MGELGEVLGKAAKYFFITIYRHLSEQQKKALLISVVCIAVLVALLELWKASRPERIEFGNSLTKRLEVLRSSSSVRPILPKLLRASLIIPIAMLFFAATGGGHTTFMSYSGG